MNQSVDHRNLVPYIIRSARFLEYSIINLIPVENVRSELSVKRFVSESGKIDVSALSEDNSWSALQGPYLRKDLWDQKIHRRTDQRQHFEKKIGPGRWSQHVSPTLSSKSVYCLKDGLWFVNTRDKHRVKYGIGMRQIGNTDKDENARLN